MTDVRSLVVQRRIQAYPQLVLLGSTWPPGLRHSYPEAVGIHRSPVGLCAPIARTEQLFAVQLKAGRDHGVTIQER
jgi:hypothetical protein